MDVDSLLLWGFAATVVLIDRGIGLVGLLLIAAAGAAALRRTSPEVLPLGAPTLLALSAAGLGSLAVLVLAPGLVHRLLSPRRFPPSPLQYRCGESCDYRCRQSRAFPGCRARSPAEH